MIKVLIGRPGVVTEEEQEEHQAHGRSEAATPRAQGGCYRDRDRDRD